MSATATANSNCKNNTNNSPGTSMGIRTQVQEQKCLPPPASCPSECRVGPSSEELSNPSSFVHWGYNDRHNCNRSRNHNPLQHSKKRKHCDGGTTTTTNGSFPNENTTTTTSSSSSTFQKAVGAFLSSGCCVIDEPVCLPPDFVQTCLDRAKNDWDVLENLMAQERERILRGDNNGKHDNGGNANDGNGNNHYRHHRMAALTRQDYSEWVARDGGRVDIRYKLNDYPYNCGGLIYNSIVFPLVKALLNGNSNPAGAAGNEKDNGGSSQKEEEAVQLLYAGVMWGMPVGNNHVSSFDNNGSSNNNDNNSNTGYSCLHQKWHADGGHLFSEHQLPEGLTLPPHCINVFYPLVDLTNENGPTEFRIGSHRRDSGDRNTEFPLLCPAGGAVLFDYRIQHRGRANLVVPSPSTDTSSNGNSNSDAINTNNNADKENARPVLYLAYAKTYFKDHGNTRSGRRLDPNTRSSSWWTTRTLEGRPVPYGKGLENYGSSSKAAVASNKTEEEPNENDASKAKKSDDVNGNNNNSGNNNKTTPTTNDSGTNEVVGERWVLFRMTLELPDGTSQVLQIHKGDVAVEVAQQFCFRHGLQDDFVGVLTETIQNQMKECID